jgi:hypothetical protein
MYYVSEANVISDVDAIFNSVNMSHIIVIRVISVDWRTVSTLSHFLESCKLKMISSGEGCTDWSAQLYLHLYSLLQLTITVQ